MLAGRDLRHNGGSARVIFRWLGEFSDRGGSRQPWLTSPLPPVQLFFGDAWRRFASFPHAQAAAGREQRATGGRDRGELGQAGLGMSM